MLLCLLLATTCTAPAQMLARPGWKGSGINTDPWWMHAVFYRIADPAGPLDFNAIAVRLDALRSLGVDALLLPAPALPPPGSNGSMPDLGGFDDLLRQAGAHDIRVLLTIHASSAGADLSGVARFWLSRGVAGLHIAAPPGTSPEDMQSMVQMVRKLASSVAGQRIVISDLDLAAPDSTKDHESTRHESGGRASRTAGPSTAQLEIDPRLEQLPTLDASGLRPLLAQTIAQPNLLVDLHTPGSSAALPGARPPLAEAVAAISVILHPAVLIDSSSGLVLPPTVPQPAPVEPSEQAAKPAPPKPAAPPPGVYLPYTPYVPPPKPHPAAASAPKPAPPADPLTTWYKRLAALHHDNAALRSGSKTFLDFDAQNVLVWVNRPASPSVLTPPVVVLCNLSSAPVQLSLSAAMTKLNLHGTFLRTLLRSDKAMGAQDLEAVTLPPFGVYIGELRR